MKKSILNVGKALDKAAQKSVNGGAPSRCNTDVTEEACIIFPHAFWTGTQCCNMVE